MCIYIYSLPFYIHIYIYNYKVLYFCFLEVIITNQGLAFYFFYFIHQGPDSCMSKAVLFVRLESDTELLYMSLYLQLFFIPFPIFFSYSVSSQFL